MVIPFMFTVNFSLCKMINNDEVLPFDTKFGQSYADEY